ncbi:hypothetical protein [Roseovarius sp. MMSF_3281]|uniref:hypothetical protein n=1 Tax=Roseovarius sp. MMSF_3281 TaxID=3046694 RepID=UPI00273E7FD6|nr:hypothetical protein [Roseovarius sp. MMSF_3281]
MKLLAKSWPQTDEGRAVGFFAQAAIELVHEKSWESYKLQALSPLARLHEAQTISQSVMNGVLPSKALDPVVEEANSSFCHDPIIRKIADRKRIEPKDIEISKDDKAQDIFTQCGFLLQLFQYRYRSTAEDLIVDECFGKKRRSEIYLLLKNYLSELVLRGHSRIQIEKKIRELFFDKVVTSVNRNTLRFFFRKFPEERREYDIYGKTEESLLNALGRLVPAEIIQGREVPRKLKTIFPKTKSEAYFKIRYKSYDHYSAIQGAGVILGIGEAMMMLFPGDQLGQVPQQLCASKRGSSDYKVSDTRPGFSRRILSYSKNSAVRHMDRVRKLVLSKDRSTEEIVGSSFFSATMMAGLGDKSTAPEVKLLTLWAAFEALLPNVPEGSTNRITHFLEYIVPAVTLSYPRDCFVEFSRELERLHVPEYKDYLEGLPIDKSSLSDRLAAVIISGDQSQQSGLCDVLKSNPLALFRLMDLQQKFSTPESFAKAVSDHRTRVEWQVQRIYRERNTVMHNGETSPAMLRILSNTYYYYLLTYASIETVAKSYGDLSIPQSLSAIRKLSQSDQAKIAKARASLKDNAIEAQSLLMQIISGHFHSDT